MIFYAWDSIKNVDDRVCYHKDKPIAVGSDFNVDPMCWAIGHRADNGLTVFDELSLRNTNTRQTLDELHARYGEHTGGWEFFGDASGSARKTSADTSDYLQIKNDKRFRDARVYYPKKNPPIASRFAACNSLMCNAAGERRLYVHPRCKVLIKDLEDRAYKQGSREPDDYGDIGHMTDGLGYIIHRCWPVTLDSLPDVPKAHVA